MADAPALAQFEHPELGFRLEFPADSEIVLDAPMVALLVLEPPTPVAFRANVAVTAEPVGAGEELESYTDDSLAAQQRVLDTLHVLDRSTTSLGDRPATRTLCHHSVDAVPVTLEQWRVLGEGTAFTVSASMGSLDYPRVADALSAIAESLRLKPTA